MENEILKTTLFKTGFHRKVELIELSDGYCYVRKTFPPDAISDRDDEWNALVYLYNEGYSVPKPIQKTDTGFSMQFIENGVFSALHKTTNNVINIDLEKKFSKLLFDLHSVKIFDKIECRNINFIQCEFTEIEHIIEKKHLDEYLKIFNKLKLESLHILNQPLCYIHRDYHPWNVLLDKNEKLYTIDLTLKQGDYRFDVAWTYMILFRTSYAAKSDENAKFAERFLFEYAKFNPNVSVDFEFFKQLANLRWLVNVIKPEYRKHLETKEKDFFDLLVEAAEKSMVKYIG